MGRGKVDVDIVADSIGIGNVPSGRPRGAVSRPVEAVLQYLESLNVKKEGWGEESPCQRRLGLSRE